MMKILDSLFGGYLFWRKFRGGTWGKWSDMTPVLVGEQWMKGFYFWKRAPWERNKNDNRELKYLLTESWGHGHGRQKYIP